jgi:hypothetical protein
LGFALSSQKTQLVDNMKGTKEYKVSLGFVIKTDSTEVNSHTHTRHLTIPFMTIIGTILQPIIKAFLQYAFAK